MIMKRIQWTGAVTLACLAATVFAQQPSPAYFQSGGTLYQAVPAVPANAQPV